MVHTHELVGTNWCEREGSLADCPYSTWTEVSYDGGKARFYHGVSFSSPPDMEHRLKLRFVDYAPGIE